MALEIKDKTVVVPGEILATGLDFVPGRGTYRNGEKIHASILGLTHVDGRTIKLIPLGGAYAPRVDDTIIAKVIDIINSGWLVDVGAAWNAMLPLKDATSEYVPKGADLSQYFAIGEYIVTKVSRVSTQRLIDLSMRGPGLRKLREGRIIKIRPCKVPRIIGKRGSMVTMIKKATDANITVGQNGVIWLAAEDPKSELIAAQAIQKIESESHTSGLTETIKSFLEKVTGRTVQVE